MAKWNILKKRDVDLISSNVKPWVDIFWVVWGFWWLEWVTSYPVWMSYSANDDDIYNSFSWTNDMRFIEDWWNIICMWCVSSLCAWWRPWRSFYYLEIRKSDLKIIKNARYDWYMPNSSWSSDAWTYMSIQNIWWINRYCFRSDALRNNRWFSVYFDWTNLVAWWGLGTPIWVWSIDVFTWNEIVQYTANNAWNQSVWPWWTPPWQQFTTLWTTTKVWMIEVFMRNNGWIYSWSNISCQIYNNNYTTLLWTSLNSVDPNTIPWWESSWIFRFPEITLNPSTQYSFRLTNSFTSSNGWVIRINYNASFDPIYSWWVFNNNNFWDLKFKMVLWDYIWRLSWWVVSWSINWAYNDMWRTYWTLNFS